MTGRTSRALAAALSLTAALTLAACGGDETYDAAEVEQCISANARPPLTLGIEADSEGSWLEDPGGGVTLKGGVIVKDVSPGGRQFIEILVLQDAANRQRMWERIRKYGEALKGRPVDEDKIVAEQRGSNAIVLPVQPLNETERKLVGDCLS